MQRSSPFMVGPMVRGHLLGLVGNWRDLRRNMASNPWGDFPNGGRGSRGGRFGGTGSDGAAGSDSDRSDTTMKSLSSSNKGTPARASATSMVTSDASYHARGANQGSFERRINREDNMWHNRSQTDTIWLNSRDPHAYKPNFRQTEPIVMRKQFMRSPDEVSREVLGRDWEEAVKAYRRSALTNMPDQGCRTGWEEQQHNTLKLVHPMQQSNSQQPRSEKNSQINWQKNLQQNTQK
ncbi:hypothetical protein KR200_001968, partial [Drosophila serrata]